MIKSFSELGQRANIRTYKLGDKDIVLYEDHRILLDILYEAHVSNLIKGVPNLIYFDYHDDACLFDTKQNRLPNIEQCGSETFWSFVEFKLGVHDDNWLSAGMQLNLINDAVCVGVEENQNVCTLNNSFKGQKQRLYDIGHLDSALSERGKLGDPIACGEAQRIKEIFHHNIQEGEQQSEPFVLDFDLDCFSMKCVDETFAWSYGIFKKKYGNELVSNYMQGLINKSSLITICRESHYCGGLGESAKILQYLDYHLFNNVLKATPISF